ncbi:hypothetical protein MRX96_013967 [Rhipicephalus microplus]
MRVNARVPTQQNIPTLYENANTKLARTRVSNAPGKSISGHPTENCAIGLFKGSAEKRKMRSGEQDVVGESMYSDEGLGINSHLNPTAATGFWCRRRWPDDTLLSLASLLLLLRRRNGTS